MRGRVYEHCLIPVVFRSSGRGSDGNIQYTRAGIFLRCRGETAFAIFQFSQWKVVFVFIAVIPVAFACYHSPCATERVASRSVYLSGPCDPMWKHPTHPTMTSPTSPLREHNREKGKRKSEAENGVELKISTPTITTLLFPAYRSIKPPSQYPAP